MWTGASPPVAPRRARRRPALPAPGEVAAFWSPDPGRPTPAEHLLVVALAVVALAGFAAVHGGQLALVALVPALVSLAWRPARAPRWLTRVAPGACRVALGSVFLMRAGLTVYPILDDERVADVALIVGWILVPLLAGAVLGTRVWRPALAAIPLSV